MASDDGFDLPLVGFGRLTSAPAQMLGESKRGKRTEKKEFCMQFNKTKICAFWEKKRCLRGFDCKYAHGGAELQDLPNLEKTSLCQDLLASGKCFNAGCAFAHSVDELTKGNMYKTTMCRFARGTCKMGSRCRHAHSEEELKQATSDAAAAMASLAERERMSAVDSVPSRSAAAKKGRLLSRPVPSGPRLGAMHGDYPNSSFPQRQVTEPSPEIQQQRPIAAPVQAGFLDEYGLNRLNSLHAYGFSRQASAPAETGATESSAQFARQRFHPTSGVQQHQAEPDREALPQALRFEDEPDRNASVQALRFDDDLMQRIAWARQVQEPFRSSNWLQKSSIAALNAAAQGSQHMQATLRQPESNDGSQHVQAPVRQLQPNDYTEGYSQPELDQCWADDFDDAGDAVGELPHFFARAVTWPAQAEASPQMHSDRPREQTRGQNIQCPPPRRQRHEDLLGGAGRGRGQERQQGPRLPFERFKSRSQELEKFQPSSCSVPEYVCATVDPSTRAYAMPKWSPQRYDQSTTTHGSLPSTGTSTEDSRPMRTSSQCGGMGTQEALDDFSLNSSRTSTPSVQNRWSRQSSLETNSCPYPPMPGWQYVTPQRYASPHVGGPSLTGFTMKSHNGDNTDMPALRQLPLQPLATIGPRQQAVGPQQVEHATYSQSGQPSDMQSELIEQLLLGAMPIAYED